MRWGESPTSCRLQFFKRENWSKRRESSRGQKKNIEDNNWERETDRKAYSAAISSQRPEECRLQQNITVLNLLCTGCTLLSADTHTHTHIIRKLYFLTPLITSCFFKAHMIFDSCSPVCCWCVGQTHCVPVEQKVVEDSDLGRGHLVTVLFIWCVHYVVSHLTALNTNTHTHTQNTTTFCIQPGVYCACISFSCTVLYCK